MQFGFGCPADCEPCHESVVDLTHQFVNAACGIVMDTDLIQRLRLEHRCQRTAVGGNPLVLSEGQDHWFDGMQLVHRHFCPVGKLVGDQCRSDDDEGMFGRTRDAGDRSACQLGRSRFL